MSRKLKIFLIAFVLSLPVWLGVNDLNYNLENFFFWRTIAKNPQILAAEASAQYDCIIIQREKERLKAVELLSDNLEESTKVVFSVEIGNKGNEKILFEKNSLEQLPIASLSKLMTALVVYELDETYKPSSIIPISGGAVAQEGSSKFGDLKEGESLSVETLMHMTLIESNNDAAYALTGLIGPEAFVDLMNLYAKDIGLNNTHFVNPTGLEPNTLGGEMNISTARDIVKLARYILKEQPQIFEITSQASYQVLNLDGSPKYFIEENTNELLGKIPNIIGGKTGWSPKAQGCLILVLEKPDGYVINVILGAEDRFGEMRKLIELIE